ncbi:MAG: hypothetical protein U1F06_08815 [Steroidobacteraceae bacterium]
MGAFEYTALDTGGRQHKGVIEGDTARHVRALLRERALLPVYGRRSGRARGAGRRPGEPVAAGLGRGRRC